VEWNEIEFSFCINTCVVEI